MPTLAELRQFARYHLFRRVADHPAREHEMGIVPLGYDPDAFERDVRAFGDRYEIREVARLGYRGMTRPMLEVRSKNLGPARRRLLVLSGVHGNEHAGILCVPRILERFVGNDVGLVLLTPVNPIGAAELSRLNGDGYDINRDFVRFDTEEARVVRRVFEEVRPDFVVSLHEGPQDASFLFANEHVRPEVARKLLAAMERGGTTLAEKDYFGTRLSPPGLSPASPAARAVTWAWAKTLQMRATIAWSALQGVPEVVLESSWRNPDREARLRPHVDLCLAIAETLR